jgi:hypothetical protein
MISDTIFLTVPIFPSFSSCGGVAGKARRGGQ